MGKNNSKYFPESIISQETSIGGIPRGVTHIHSNPEEDSLRVSFEFYNRDSCDVLNKKHKAEFGKSLFRNVLETFVNVCEVSCMNLNEANIRTDSISRENKNYTDLFNELPEDATLFHHNVGGKQRLFYFYDSKYFFPVAVTVNHR